MRILHVGDIHLQEGPNLDDTMQALAQVSEIAGREEVECVIIPGDIFEKKSTPTERALFGQWLYDLGARVLMCKGNHDAPDDLRVFGGYEAVSVAEKPFMEVLPGLDVLMLPWPEKAHLAAAGFTGEGGAHEAQKALGTLIRTMAMNRDTSRPLVVMGHLSVVGAVASSGQPLVGREIQVLVDDFADSGAVYVALNHIHKAQIMGGWGIRYAGSLTIQNFGEEGEEKGVMLVDTDPRQGYWRPITGRRWITVEASAFDAVGGRSYAENYPEDIDPNRFPPDCNVRYRYTCDEADEHLFDHAAITRRFADAHTLKIVPQVTRAARVRAGEVAEARTLGDKLTAWGVATGSTIPEGLRSKLQVLEGGAK